MVLLSVQAEDSSYAVVVLENILRHVLGFLGHLQSTNGVRKPLTNGLVVKVFDGRFMVPTILIHLSGGGDHWNILLKKKKKDLKRLLTVPFSPPPGPYSLD